VTDLQKLSGEFMQTAQKLPALYELAADWLELAVLFEESEDDEQRDALALRLDELEGKLEHKSENIVGLARWYDALAAARRDEARRMADGARSYEGRAEWLRSYLVRAMQTLGIDHIDTSKYSIRLRLNNPHVEVLEESLVPSEFRRTRITVDTDKAAILQHYKATGEVVDGTEIARGTRLDVR